MARLQRMAGLLRAAQVMYWRGAAQKVTGAMLTRMCGIGACRCEEEMRGGEVAMCVGAQAGDVVLVAPFKPRAAPASQG